MDEPTPSAETGDQATRRRAIRRAVEGTAHIRRPADWTPIDYERFEATLRRNGMVIQPAQETPTDG